MGGTKQYSLHYMKKKQTLKKQAEAKEFIKNVFQWIPDIKVDNVRKDPLNPNCIIATVTMPKNK